MMIVESDTKYKEPIAEAIMTAKPKSISVCLEVKFVRNLIHSLVSGWKTNKITQV